MSKTRNQRARLRRAARRLAFVALTVLLLLSLSLVAYLWCVIERYQAENGERIRAPIYTLESFGIPEERMGDYEEACRRYEVENHLVLPQFTSEGGE